jgi:hypothetical protein
MPAWSLRIGKLRPFSRCERRLFTALSGEIATREAPSARMSFAAASIA